MDVYIDIKLRYKHTSFLSLNVLGMTSSVTEN